MPQIFANNATSTLSAPINAAATAVLIQAGQGGRFPTIAGPDFCFCTLEDSLGNIEIIKVTAHASNAQSFTVERAQQGTSARSWAIGDLFELRFTAAEAGAWEADIDALQASRAIKAGDTYTGGHNFTGADVRVATPTQASQPATKGYADSLAFATALPAQAGNARKVSVTDGTNAGWGDWWGTPVPLTVANNGQTLDVRRTYHLDSNGGAFAVTLPTMAAGDWIKFVDVTGKCGINNVTINSGGNGTFRDGDTTLIVDQAFDSFETVRTSTGVIEQ